MKRIYLDNAAATPMDPRVLDVMMPYLTTAYGNPSSLHYFGQQARSAVQTARSQVAHCLGVKGEDLVFTSGGTEADNLAILGFLRANYPHGGHLVTTAVEHHAVLRTFQALEGKGYDVTYVPVEADGRVTADAVAQALRDDTVLISVMYANNETGMVQPIDAIGALARQKGIAFHVDAVQAFGYVPIRPLEQGIDMLTVCSHKIYGPKVSAPCTSATDCRSLPKPMADPRNTACGRARRMSPPLPDSARLPNSWRPNGTTASGRRGA